MEQTETAVRTLYIISKGIGKLPEETMLRMEETDRIPRASLLEKALRAELLDERYLEEKVPASRRWIYRFVSVTFAQILEALLVQHRYDVVFSQSEKVGLPLALLKKIMRLKTPHVVIISRITSPDPSRGRKKKWFVRQTGGVIGRFLIWSSVQRRIAVRELGVPEQKIVLLKRGTDQKFWRPSSVPVPSDMICSVGMEARDYPTLVEALRPLDIPCHIAVGDTRGEIFSTVKRLYDISDLPAHITVGRKQQAELRKLYWRSRFVVISLLPTDSDNGLTAILEAMASGKAVICSRVEGQVDVIEDGVTGMYVPQGDPEALRKAVLQLWNDPERAAAMGRAARCHIEEHHTLERFVERIRQEVQEVVRQYRMEESSLKEGVTNQIMQ